MLNWKHFLAAIGISFGNLATTVAGVWAFYKSEFVYRKRLVSAINRSTSRGITPDFATYREGLGEALWSWIMNPIHLKTDQPFSAEKFAQGIPRMSWMSPFPTLR